MIVESKILINKSIEEVWEYFNNPENLALWLSSFEKLEHLEGVPGEVGAKSKHYYRNNRKLFELTETITKKEKYRYLCITLENPVMISRIENRFNSIGNDTELVAISETKFKPIMLKIMSTFMKKAFQKRQHSDLEKLKEVIEEL